MHQIMAVRLYDSLRIDLCGYNATMAHYWVELLLRVKEKNMIGEHVCHRQLFQLNRNRINIEKQLAQIRPFVPASRRPL